MRISANWTKRPEPWSGVSMWGLFFSPSSFLASLTALENVMLPVELRGDTLAQSHAKELLEKVGLAERLDHYPRQLSGW